MSRGALQYCSHPACPVLTEGGPCRDHARVVEERRGSAGERGYGALHRRQRKVVLARDPICRGCGEDVSAVDDHIIPKNAGGHPHAMDNRQGLCVACHGYKIVAEQRDPTFGPRLRAEGQKLGQRTPMRWRALPQFGGRKSLGGMGVGFLGRQAR